MALPNGQLPTYNYPGPVFHFHSFFILGDFGLAKEINWHLVWVRFKVFSQHSTFIRCGKW